MLISRTERHTTTCNRIRLGPLAFAKVIAPAVSSIVAQITIATQIDHVMHADTMDGWANAPVTMGGKCSWYCDNSGEQEGASSAPWTGRALRAYTKPLSLALAHQIEFREKVRASRKQNSDMMGKGVVNLALDDNSLTTDIYLPFDIAAALKASNLKGVRAVIGDTVEQVYHGLALMRPADSKAKDVWKVKEMSDAPGCKACGWRFQEIPLVSTLLWSCLASEASLTFSIQTSNDQAGIFEDDADEDEGNYRTKGLLGGSMVQVDSKFAEKWIAHERSQEP